MSHVPAFTRYISIDYSGAKTPDVEPQGPEMLPRRLPVATRRSSTASEQYRTRRGIAEWLVERLQEPVPTIVGIDHGFSFPLKYVDAHELPHNWPRSSTSSSAIGAPTKTIPASISVRDGSCSDGALRAGKARWRRLTEIRAGAAKSVLHFDVQDSVAKSARRKATSVGGCARRCRTRSCSASPARSTVPTELRSTSSGLSTAGRLHEAIWVRPFILQSRAPCPTPAAQSNSAPIQSTWA
jgi:hypothetical protein